MAKHEFGELIVLCWEDYPGYEIVRGHVSDIEANSAMIAEYGVGEVPPIKSIEHKYGRWGVGMDETGERMQMFYDYETRGRGRFPVTIVRVEFKPI